MYNAVFPAWPLDGKNASDAPGAYPDPKDDPAAAPPEGLQPEGDMPELGDNPPEPSIAQRIAAAPEAVRDAVENYFRGRTQAAKRGVGNLHLAERYAFDKDGEELRKGDVVNIGKRDARGRKGQWARPEADGYIQNILIETTKEELKDEDGNTVLDDAGKPVLVDRPVLDAAGNPVVKSVVVRHYDPKYIGGDHKWKKEKGLGIPWPFPYWDFEIKPGDLGRVNDKSDRAQAVFEQFGLHGRRMAGRGAGRLAPAIGKMFRLERMANVQPIQNRFMQDKNARLIGEGDIVRYNGEIYSVIRPNNPWDNNGRPRVVLRPEGGGRLAMPLAENVEYIDHPKNLIFLRGAGGVVAPTPKDIARVLTERGIRNPDIIDALGRGDFEAAARAMNADTRIADFLNAEALRREEMRDRIEIENRRGRKPAGFVPVGEAEYALAQMEKADAVILQAAKNGFFANDAGEPRPLDREIQKDLFGDYVGAELDIAMREAYVELQDLLGDLQRDGGNTVVLGEIRALLAEVGNRPLNSSAERKKALDRLDAIRGMVDALGDSNGGTAVDKLRDAINTWGDDFDRRQAAAPGGPPSMPPAGPPPATPANAPEPGGPRPFLEPFPAPAPDKGDRDYLNDVLDGLGAADPGLRRLLDAYNQDFNALPDDRRDALAQIIDNIARDEAPEADKQRLRDIADRIRRQEPLQGRPATPEPAATA